MSYLIYMKQAMANLFKPPVTSKYPLEPKTFCEGCRGRVANDVSRCILCGLCERNCPTGAITVDRKTGTWRINPFACIQCGMCVANCPKKCLSMDAHYTEPSEEKSEVVMAAVQKDGRVESHRQVAAIRETDEKRFLDDKSHVVINITRCVFCGMCQRNCPEGAIMVDRPSRMWRIDLEKCVNCGTCIDNCPRKCLSLGCYVGNQKEVTVYGTPPERRAPIKKEETPALPEKEKSTPKEEIAVDMKEAVSVSENSRQSAGSTAAAENSANISENPTHVSNRISACLFCGRCEHTCPVGAITVDRKNRTWSIDREKCVTCGACVAGCPAKCLSMKDEFEEGEDRSLQVTLQGPPPAPRRPVKKEAAPSATNEKDTPHA